MPTVCGTRAGSGSPGERFRVRRWAEQAALDLVRRHLEGVPLPGLGPLSVDGRATRLESAEDPAQRLFLAVEVPLAAVDVVSAAVGPWRESFPTARWMPPGELARDAEVPRAARQLA